MSASKLVTWPHPAGTLVVFLDEHEHVVLTRTSGPAYPLEDGEIVVPLEGVDVLYSVNLVAKVDDVRAFIGSRLPEGEPVSPGEIGETGCPGCSRLGMALCVLQEAHRRAVHEQWPPFTNTSPAAHERAANEPEDPDAN
jgi:hypothetical protein